MSWEFTVPVAPVPKARPRHNTKTGTTYTPARTTDYESMVALHFRRGNVGYGPPRDGRFRLSGIFYVSRDDADLDNLVKSVMDGLQGVAYLNDKQVKAFGSFEIHIDRVKPRFEGLLEIIPPTA